MPLDLIYDDPASDVLLDAATGVRRTVLPGGVRLLTETDRSVRSATLGLWLPVGSRDEKPEHAGSTHVLEHLLRIGRQVIISFPNFGHWRVRAELAFRGRMPVTDFMPEPWYDTPNIHHCTIRDFVGLCRDVGAHIEKATALDARGRPMRFAMPWWFWNLIGAQGVFLLRRGR